MTRSLNSHCACALLLLALPSSAYAADTGAPAARPRIVPAVGHHAVDCGGQPCDAVARGAAAFVDRRLGANGRACADCHVAVNRFQLSPAIADARFLFRQWKRLKNPDYDDPLFRPIDADDFRTNGEGATDFRNLRQNGLVRITFDLPSNVRLVDSATGAPSGEVIADVWRSVPTVDDVVLTGPDEGVAWQRGPNPSGGYQLDARVTTLQEQALGALTHHAQLAEAPPPQLLDDLAAFEHVTFSNSRVRALAKAIRDGDAALPDPDPPLDALEQQGKAVFIRACTQCHGGPGLSTPQDPVVRYHDISSQCPRPVDTARPPRWSFAPCPPRLARNARTYEITLADGTKARRTSDDPGRALLTGVVGGAAPADDWNKFDTPGLRGIAGTAPYFHNNSAATLEDVVDHYIEFFKRVQANAAPGVVPPIASTDGVHFDRTPTQEERAALIAYLRKLQ